jgi:ATPase subunit of ABC transporter with duplicated ATPase domains
MTTELRVTTAKETWNRDAGAVEGLDLAIGSKVLLTNTAFTVSREERIALLGRNGCGKSTLFHWLATRTNSWSIYEVAQELAPTAQSVISVVLGAHLERGQLWARQAELDSQEEDLSDAELAEYTAIGDKLASMRADADPPRARRILHGLGFAAAQMDGPLTHLSGGWRARVALAQGLFMEPDLLLLDEPTNHLDLNGVLWLQEYLRAWPKTLIVISHNAGFVREVATTQWLLARDCVTTYKCRFDRYLKLRAVEEKKREKDWDALEKEVAALKKKGTPAARKAAEDLLAKRTRDGVARPEKRYAPKFFFMEAPATTRAGALISTECAQLGYDGHVVLADVTFALHQGCRVALVGANGAGKSTLLKFLAGEMGALDGEAGVQRRTGLRICKFDQHFYHSLPEELTPLQHLATLAPVMEDGARVGVDVLRKILGATGLEGAAHTRPIGTLSGGQKARVYFGSVAVQAPDILLMDEPTNHLDMETVAGLQEGLRTFPGAAVIVSHDVDFLEEVATEVWCTAGGRLERLGEGVDGLAVYVDRVVAEMEV